MPGSGRPPEPGAPDFEPDGRPDEPPPILRSWRALYGAVIGELLLVIAFCRWLSGWGR